MTDLNLNAQTLSLPAELQRAAETALADWTRNRKIAALWQKDQSVWTNEDEAKWLGWLDIVERQIDDTAKFAAFRTEVQEAGFTHILLMGMGGSSLAPEVFAETFGKQIGFPEFHVLDSTVPAQVAAVEAKIDLANTLFFVSSKSGSTLEPNVFKQYFFDRVSKLVGAEKAGQQFVAITDPNSKMEAVAKRDGFRRIFYGLPDIGGRFSALSDFGMIPAAAMGLNVSDFLQRTQQMVEACKIEDANENPGAVLGAVLGAANKLGRDKLTIITAPTLYDVGAWLEQLIAESTGKTGVSIIPVDREKLVGYEDYGDDRVFAYLRLENDLVPNQETVVGQLERFGHPVITITLPERENLGQEFFRWEFATAVAGAVMQINPFNQPDVEAAKIETRKLTDEVEKTGALPTEAAFYEEDSIRLFTDRRNVAEMDAGDSINKTLKDYLTAHLARIKPNDYFALLAYIEMNQENQAWLQEIRHAVLDKHKVATCLGFGPRFLHSTGQAYKGGANNGVFLQITSDDSEDLLIPEQKYTFGAVKAAQARGDFQVLLDRNRRALRVHLGADVKDGLQKLLAAIR